MLGFALVGCGRIAQKHADLLHGGHIKGARLVAVCDVKADRAEKYGAKYGVPHFTDMHAMMGKLSASIDALAML